MFRLDPLPVPVEARTASDAGNHPAVLQLFADRAQRVHPGFELDADTTPKVHALCTSLDGLPLAVELAAGRLAALDIDDLRARLDRRLDLLGAARGSPDDRHRTLRATFFSVDWIGGVRLAALRPHARVTGAGHRRSRTRAPAAPRRRRRWR